MSHPVRVEGLGKYASLLTDAVYLIWNSDASHWFIVSYLADIFQYFKSFRSSYVQFRIQLHTHSFFSIFCREKMRHARKRCIQLCNLYDKVMTSSLLSRFQPGESEQIWKNCFDTFWTHLVHIYVCVCVCVCVFVCRVQHKYFPHFKLSPECCK